MELPLVFLRFILTFVLSFAFGLERQRSHKPVGFGTYTFVASGACALSIAAITLNKDNPFSLLSAIVTGIGFLGAGALIKTSDKIFGFTSASSIWLFAIFGMTIGIGQYFLAGLIYVIVWIVILYDRNLESKGIGSYQKKLQIVTNKIVSEKEVRKVLVLETKNHKLMSVSVSKKDNKLVYDYVIEGTREHLNKIPQRLFSEEWFDSCKIE
ncbi:MAG: MgtC/SapB family protein [Nanoarchaeota archaeon]|nr:MgtC/SapB family protein [Nanoarchaeota archaeon]